MGRMLRKGVVFTLLFAGLVTPAAANPMLMFLIGIARDMVVDFAQNRKDGPPPEPVYLPDMAKVYPGTTIEPDTIRKLIDDSFLYLSSSQREEIFNSLNAELLKPKNAAVRGAMIQYFADRALVVRAAQLQLAKMPYREKQQLAEEFKTELAGLPEDDQKQIGQLLRRGMLPVPSDLNQLLLAAYDAR